MATVSLYSKTYNSITAQVVFDNPPTTDKSVKMYLRLSGGSWSNYGTVTADGTNTTYYFTYSGLSSSTNYEISGDSYVGTTAVTYGAFIPVTTDPAPAPPQGTTGISATATSGHTFYVTWNTISGANGYYLYKSSDGGLNYYPWRGVGLSADVGNVTSISGVPIDYEWQNYRFQVTPYNAYGNGSNNYSADYKSLDETAPSITAFYTTQIQQAQITVYISGNDNNPSAGTPSGLYRFRMYRGGSLVGYANINGGANNSAQSTYYTYTGLVAKTQYTLEAIAEDNSGNLTPSGSWVIYPTTIDNRPTNWSWYTTKTSGANFDLTAAEWNAFTARINQFQTYKTITNTSFTTAPYSDGQFYAFMFNQARDAIAAMSPSISPPASQSSGNIIYASLLDGLRDSLNSIA